MVSAPPPITMFLHLRQERPLWVELKTNGGVVFITAYYTFIILFL